jgi:bacillolysin
MTTRLTWSAACLASLMAVAALQGQTRDGRGRLLTIVPESIGAVRDSDSLVDRMVRAGELRVRLERDDTLVAGHRMEQLAQYYKGARVWGGDVTRQFDAAGTVSVFGTVYQNIELDTTPGLSIDAAAAALGRLGTLLNPTTEPTLVILPADGGAFTLAWVGQVFTRRDVVRIFIDATTGQVVRRYGMLQRQAANAAVGHGTGVLGDDKKVSATPMSGTFIASDPLRPPAINTLDLRGDLNRALDILGNARSFVTADIAANPSNDWTDAAVVDAHAYAAYTYDYYFKRFGRRGLDNADRRILNMVHLVRRSDVFTASDDVFQTFFMNAFYCGDCAAGGAMVYGEGLPGGVLLSNGQHFDFFSGALDVVAHELTHGVTNFTSRLEYVNESGALNEAFSDIMGTSVEFFIQPAGTGQMQADYLIGEDIAIGVRAGVPSGVRSMENPALFDQPDHYSKRVVLPPDDEHDNGGVHINSGIANQAFYLAIEGGTNRTSGIRVTGVGAANREQIEKVFYRAFAQLMPSTANYSMARAITLRAAQDLYGLNSASYNAVRDAWTAVGVN